MEKQAYAGNPLPAKTFKARYWEAQHVYPFLPLHLETGESLMEQKMINNLMALNIQQRKHLIETREAEVTTRRELQKLYTKLHKLENLIAFALCLIILLAVIVGLMWRALG